MAAVLRRGNGQSLCRRLVEVDPQYYAGFNEKSGPRLLHTSKPKVLICI